MSENPCAVWDFRFSENSIKKEELIEILNKHCKKWCFQLEKGEESGYIHWQGRLSLNKKKRKGTILKSIFKPEYLAPTLLENIRNDFYQTKEETRIEGPWRNDDKPKFVPWDLQKVTKLKNWQEYIKNDCKKQVERTINVVIDLKGNNGKTTLIRWLGINRVAFQIPPINDHKDLMRIVMDAPKYGAYTMDLPRAMKKEKLYSMWAAIETVKDGYCYDDRYSFKYEYINPPVFWVFTNVKPEISLLSRDRWKFWEIEGEDLKSIELL